MKSIVYLAPLLFLLPSCDSFKSCPERLAEAAPLADSLFVMVDSAGFHEAATQVVDAAKCIEQGDASAAEKLDAGLSKTRVETYMECWSCHSQIHEMAEYHTVLVDRSNEMSDEDWNKAMALWNAMVYDVEHPSMKCTDEDRSALLAMKTELAVVGVVGVVGGEWQELMEEVGEEIENALEDAEEFLKDLFE